MFIILCRFKIHVKVKDGTGEATLMLLDWTAQGQFFAQRQIKLRNIKIGWKLIVRTKRKQ